MALLQFIRLFTFSHGRQNQQGDVSLLRAVLVALSCGWAELPSNT